MATTKKSTEKKAPAKKPAAKKTTQKTSSLPPVGSAEYKAMVLRGEIKEQFMAGSDVKAVFITADTQALNADGISTAAAVGRQTLMKRK